MKHNLNTSVTSYFAELCQKAFDKIIQISRKCFIIWCVLEGGHFYCDPTDRKAVDCISLQTASQAGACFSDAVHTIPVKYIPQSSIKLILRK